MNISWRTIERVVFLVTILTGVIFYIRDEAKERAVRETTVENLMEKMDEMNNKLDRHETYWKNQSEINGRVITYIDIDSR